MAALLPNSALKQDEIPLPILSTQHAVHLLVTHQCQITQYLITADLHHRLARRKYFISRRDKKFRSIFPILANADALHKEMVDTFETLTDDELRDMYVWEDAPAPVSGAGTRLTQAAQAAESSGSGSLVSEKVRGFRVQYREHIKKQEARLRDMRETVGRLIAENKRKKEKGGKEQGQGEREWVLEREIGNTGGDAEGEVETGINVRTHKAWFGRGKFVRRVVVV